MNIRNITLAIIISILFCLLTSSNHLEDTITMQPTVLTFIQTFEIDNNLASSQEFKTQLFKQASNKSTDRDIKSFCSYITRNYSESTLTVNILRNYFSLYTKSENVSVLGLR